MSTVGIAGDLHLPFVHPLYLSFVQDTFEEWDVSQVHFAGDIVDNHAVSFWETDPNGHSAETEATLAAELVEDWSTTFPCATVSIGNHDARHYRVANKAGIPDRFVRPYKEVWATPEWDWQFHHVFDSVLYEHGTGSSGKDAAINRAMQKRTSLVMGHVHCYAGVKWHANETNRIFGLNVGTGIACDEYAFKYGKQFPTRPILGCGIVVDGSGAYFEPMPCGVGEEYHSSRA